MADDLELKACPFCGDEGEHIERSNPMSKWRHSIDCSSTTCGASGPVEANKAEAIAAWNTRHDADRPSTASSDLVERLRRRTRARPSYLYGDEGSKLINPDGAEAADFIQKLEEALRPFAEAGRAIERGEGVWVERPFDGYLTKDHLLNAAALLPSSPQTMKETKV